MGKKYYGNEQYYLDAFERLDAVGKNTWNWAAFFLGSCWMAYRKMYAYSFLALLLVFFVPFPGSLIAHILFGIFGNALYYRVVKSRIVNGYHLLENFQPVSIVSGSFGGAFVFISFLADEFLRCKHFQRNMLKDSNKVVPNFEISPENIGAYLYEFRKKHIVSWIADAAMTVCFVLQIILSIFIFKEDSFKKIIHHLSYYKEKHESYIETKKKVMNELDKLVKNLGTDDETEVLNITGRKEPLPDDFGKLKKLEVLNIAGTDFESLPESFGNLEKLEVLNISGCNLKTLPESFGNLKRLEVLNISSCSLRLLPNSFGNLSKLEVLNISGCKLSCIPDSIGNLKKLEALSLAGNDLTELPESLGNLLNLRKLNLSNNRLTKLPESLSRLTDLKEIDLRNTQLREVPEYLRNRPGLKVKF